MQKNIVKSVGKLLMNLTGLVMSVLQEQPIKIPLTNLVTFITRPVKINHVSTKDC